MKRINLFFTIFLLTHIFIIAQVENDEQCVNCEKNQIERYSSALGVKNYSTGLTSFASGEMNSSLGDYSSTLGYGNVAEGKYSLAGGENCIASGKRSFAFGRYAVSESSISLALGSFNRAYGTNAIAMGCFVEATNENAVVIGRGIGDTSRIVNNNSNTMMVGFNSNLHTFFIDRASGRNTTGKIGIGNITNLEAKLHLLGDDDPYNAKDASLFIESAGNRYSFIYLGDKDHYIKTKPNYNLEFNAAGQDFYFNGGKVGIGTTDFGNNKLAVAGNIKTEGLEATGNIGATNIVASGFMEATEIEVENLKLTNGAGSNKILLSDNEGSASWVPQSSLDDGDWSTAETGDLYFNAGKVGIGTSSPNSQLQLTEDLTVNDKAHIGNGVSAMHFGQAYSSTFGYGTGYVGYNAERIADQNWLLRSDGAHNGGNILYGNIFGDMNFICIEPGSNPGSDQEINFQEINQNIKMRLTNDGRLGVGVLDPEEMLEVSGNISATKYFGDGSELSGTGDDLGNHTLQQKLITAGHWINSDTDDNQGIFIDGGGSVGIGTINFGSGTTTYKLAVAGAIRAEEVQIEHVDTWYDCVFEDHYRLTPLKEVETFVNQNKHLPEVPSEAEVKENGISVGQMNAILLKKVEELTLHLIEQEKKIEKLEKALGQQ